MSSRPLKTLKSSSKYVCIFFFLACTLICIVHPAVMYTLSAIINYYSFNLTFCLLYSVIRPHRGTSLRVTEVRPCTFCCWPLSPCLLPRSPPTSSKPRMTMTMIMIMMRSAAPPSMCINTLRQNSYVHTCARTSIHTVSPYTQYLNNVFTSPPPTLDRPTSYRFGKSSISNT